MSASAYPLQWPEGWPRTSSPERARFQCRFAQARDGIIRQLELMGVGDWNIVISTNIPLRRDGLPYAGQRDPEDRGVAVFWSDKGEQRVIACDRWDRVKDNLRALEKTIEAMRGIERWGSTDIVNKAFTGFAALPAPAEGWRVILGNCSTVEEANRQWKKLAFERHPDRGGSDSEMYELNTAWHQAEKELRA